MSVGGGALGQSELIVDPWAEGARPALERGAAPRAEERAWARQTGEGPAAHPIVDPWQAAPSEPTLDPWRVASPTRSAARHGAPAPSEAGDLWVPAPNAAVRAGAPAHRLRPERPSAAPKSWATVVVDIVDPWANGPVTEKTDPAIVDPWARAAVGD